MLRIEKLFLQGFKSFCDPTEIVLDQEGITAVVGPNGCGKSNVADAISWVIGEQRAKALRGGKMEDVIFQGSRNRQPAGMAEVLLTLVVRETFEIRGETMGAAAETQAMAAATLAAQTTAQATAIQAELAAPTASSEPTSSTDTPDAAVDSTSADQHAETAADQSVTPIPAHKKRRKVSADSTTRVFHEGERITVGRRLYRTGESEYEMNGRQCRLRDVQDLFAGTGLGGAHYAIIEQGRIGQVLSAKPMDRRALLEEAAGVSKFKLRQHAAELKLEAAKQNLSRLTDILTEIERQQNSLKRQAARARRYQRLRQEVRDLLRAVYVVDYRHTRQTLAELEETLIATAARATALTATMAQLEAAQAEATQAARAAEEELNEARQLAGNCELEAARANQQRTYLTEQLQALGARQQQFVQDQSAIHARGQFIAQERARLRAELHRCEAEINTESKLLADAEGAHQAQALSDAAAEAQLEAQRQQFYEAVTRAERWRQLRQQFIEAVERKVTRLDGLRLERERAAAQARGARDRYAELSASLEELEARQQHVADQLTAVANQLAELRRQREERQQQLSQTERELTATEQRLQSLTQIDERRTYFSEAVQVLTKSLTTNGGPNNDGPLNSQAADHPAAAGTPVSAFRVLGTLADFVRVAPEHEAMIESALRDELQYVVVPTFEDALRAIDFLKGQQAGRATFLVVGRHTAETNGATADGYHSDGHHESPATTLAALLGLRPEFADAFTFALPALAHAQIVDEPQQALRLSTGQNGSSHGLTSLTATGERVVAGRLITGGGGLGAGLGVLALKRELSELTQRLSQLNLVAQRGAQELQTTAAGIGQLEEQQRDWDGEARQLENQLAARREQWQQCQRELERAHTHTRVVEQETAQIETERQEAEAKQQHAAIQTDEAEAARRAAENVIETAQAELARLRRLAGERLQELSRRRAEFAAQTERRRGLQNDLRRLENEAHELEGRLTRHRLEAVEADNQTEELQSALLGITDELQQLTVARQQRAAALEQRAATLQQARHTADEIENELRTARHHATEVREERMQSEIEKARLSSDLHHLIQACHTELGEDIAVVCARLETNAVSPHETLTRPATVASAAAEAAPLDEDEADAAMEISFWQVPEDFDLALAKARLDELRAKIEALGPVNMMALEELTEIEERFSFLTAQRADLEQAIADTLTAIAEIKRRSRERFQEAFCQVNENFKGMFQELFGGGQGEMRLIDESDVLESGIEIIAQPPGKRLQNVLLLSGGEKAMTALALVLAIFKYRPSPFCLLDEVDAPLDEVNIGRFADKVTELGARTQFMIITHNKRTMEAARTLYGVTMEDPGVSKLVSVRFA